MAASTSVYSDNTPKLYPLLFKQNLHTLVWGTEMWNVSAVPESTSFVANGPLAGKSLLEIVDFYGGELLGESVSARYFGKMPLLLKVIDAQKDLSIQVHPNDEMAQTEHGKFGKTEMWYIIDAKEGAYLYAGFKEKLTPEEYESRVKDGTICNALARHEVHTGDVFYLPAGRVHAICGGIKLVEVQQSSDVTYRIYDYNRPGLDGKPRQLHTNLAKKAIDFNVEKDYRTHYQETDKRAVPVIDTPFFDVRIMDISDSFHRNLIKYDSFVISTCIKGECKIRLRDSALMDWNNREVVLTEGSSCLIPATVADYDIVPTHGTVRILDAHIDNKDRSLSGMVTRFLHLTRK